MPKTNFTKIKLLKLWEILSQDSDEDHPLSTSQIIEKLKIKGYAGETVRVRVQAYVSHILS